MRISDWSSDVCSSDLQADPDFDWTPYLKTLIEVFGQFGLKLDALPRATMDTAIRPALIKNDSIASQLDLSFAGAGKPKPLRIKLEIDVNPPPGPGEASCSLDFPAEHDVRSEEQHSELQSLM